MSNNTEKPLLIYSASAGSGKTYTLVKTYLELILKGEAVPTNFSKIIAMTFTNKAALEMKTRVIEALADLSNPNRHVNPKEIEKALNYQRNIAAEFEMNIEAIQKKSQIALTHILHQYEDFFVMTIDKFNLRLIRSFAMDLDIEANFKVVIDETEIKQRVVDDFLNEIDPNMSSLLSRIFVLLAEGRMENESSWDFESELVNYLEILEKEDTIELLSQAQDITNEKEYIDSIKASINFKNDQLTRETVNFIQEITPQIEQLRKTDKRRANSIEGNVGKLAHTPIPSEVSFTDAVVRYIKQEEITEPILSTLSDYYEKHTAAVGEIENLNKIKSSFLYIQLLRKINERLKEFRKTEQIIRISEFNQMISELLKNEAAPYIYEKLGTRFNHFLLDEFQDTSRLQWQNIVPLVHESISQQHKNLIVGDPKQSIYRFRGGIADQFVVLPAIYNPKNDPHFDQLSIYFSKMGKKDELKDNYRSTKDVVEFNNLFFSHFISFIRNVKLKDDTTGIDFSNYYDKIEQNPKNVESGFVELVSKFDKKTKTQKYNEEENEEGESTTSPDEINYLLQCVSECLQDGFQKGDICILGDTAVQCNKYALALTNQGHKVVSVDSLSVNSDLSVRLCIIYLLWRSQPSNDLLAKQFAYTFLVIKCPDNSTETFMRYFCQKTSVFNPSEQFTYFDYKSFVSDYFGGWEVFQFSFENLYTLLEQFYKIAGLSELSNPYLHALSDMAFNFDLDNGPNLNAFVEYYNNKGKKISIQTPENNEAIKIMTAHKSKGLEFKVVIIPQLNSTFLKGRSKYLVELDKQLAYVSVSKSSKSQELRNKYKQEFEAALLDKLNLSYVAFTRPIKRLYVMSIFNEYADTDFGSTFIHPFVQSEIFASNTVESLIDDTSSYFKLQFGKRVKNNLSSEIIIPSNEFIPIDITDKLWFPEISLKHHLETVNSGLAEQLRYGRQLHFILSELHKFNSLNDILTTQQKKGIVESSFMETLKSDLQRITSHPFYKELHKDNIQIINEQDIITSINTINRPDKIICKKEETIVLDYKTGLKDKKHQKQVATYCSTLREMNFPNVKGIILYTKDMEFVQVV